PVLVGGVGGDEVAEALAATLAAVVQRAEMSIVIDVLPLERIIRDDRARRLALAERGAARGDVGGAACTIDRERREVGLDLIPFRRDVLAEAARAEATLLRDDLDDAGGGVRAVERCRRRTLHHLDALDVVGIE